jgi:transketolase
MNYNPDAFDAPNADRFILSKGHAAPLLYAVWKQLGKVSDAELLTLRQFNSVLEGHPTRRFPYTEAATGSLGQGLSIGVGMALAAKRYSGGSARTFVLLGDSEMAEGANWEALLLAQYYHLDNLVALIDVNGLGQRGEPMERGDAEQYATKLRAFGCEVHIVDGHSMSALVDVFSSLASGDGQPKAIIARTIKGYGLDDVIEGQNGFHGKVIPPEKLTFFLDKLAQRFAEVALLPEPSVYVPLAPEPVEGAVEFAPKEHPTQRTYKVGDLVATREAYGHAVTCQGFLHENLVVLDAEVKNSTYAELFEKAYPERFIECFIAEQNMIGMAVGMARQGKLPFASTFASFLTRAHDQLRMASIGGVPLRLVGSHAGVSIGADGPSQMGLEDIALFRTLPESIIFYPADAVAAQACVALMVGYHTGISYLRTTRGTTPVIYDETRLFEIGGCAVVRCSDHDDVCVVAAGITLFEALKAAELLARENIFVRVIDCYCIKPLPIAAVAQAVAACGGRLVTVEDHYRAGGLGEALAAQLDGVKHISLAVDSVPRSGSPEELLSFEEIDSSALIRSIHCLLG